MRYYVSEGGSVYSPLVSQLGSQHWFLSDALGSTIGLTSAAGSLTDTFKYQAFGAVVARSGTAASPLRFLGQYGLFDEALLPIQGTSSLTWLLSAMNPANRLKRLASLDVLMHIPFLNIPIRRQDIHINIFDWYKCYKVAERVHDWVGEPGLIPPAPDFDKLQHCLANCVISHDAGSPCGLWTIPIENLGKNRWPGQQDFGEHARADSVGLLCSHTSCFDETNPEQSCASCCARNGYNMSYPIFSPGLPDLWLPIA